MKRPTDKLPGTRKTSNVIDLKSQNPLLLRRASEKADAGDFLGALRLLRRAYECTEPDSHASREAALMIADVFLDMGCSIEAASWCAPLLRPDIDEFRSALLRLGHCYAMRGEYALAMEAFDYAVAPEVSPAPPLVTDELLNAYDSIDFCERFIAEDETADAPALRDVDEIECEKISEEAISLSNTGKNDEAAAMLEDALKRYPDSLTLFSDLMIIFYVARRYNDALALYETGSENFKGNLSVQCCLAMVYYRLGMAKEMNEAADRVMAMNTRDLNDLARIYTTMMEICRFVDAYDAAEIMREDQPYNRTFIHFSAHAAYETGNFTLARSLYDTSIEVEPHDSFARYYRDICTKSMEDGEKRRFRMEYGIPPAEFLARCQFTDKLIRLGRGEWESFYSEHRDDILTLLDWALTDPDCPFAEIYLLVVATADPDYAAGIMRRLLTEPNSSDGMRKLCATHLKLFFGMHSDRFTFLMLEGGSLNFCTVTPAPQGNYPECYRRILSAVRAEAERLDPKLAGPAVLIADCFAAAEHKLRPRLSYGQEEAITAAIIYYALTLRDDASPDIDEFAAERGVTRRRIENALKRLSNISLFAPDDAESGDDNDE